MIHITTIVKKHNPTLAAMIKNVFIEHDAPKEGTVYSDPTTNDLFALFQTPKSILWVAEEDGIAKGCCGIYLTPNLPVGYAELVKFYLHKDLRNQKIGLQLFEKSIASAMRWGYTHLYIESLPHYGRAVHMYKKFGFSILEKPLGDSGHTSCNIWMVKTL